MQLEQVIIDATEEIFSSMVMLGTTPGPAFVRSDAPLVDSVSGIIRLDGAYCGLLAIHLPTQSALEVSGSFLDLHLDEVGEDVCDAVGELANMLAGNVKAVLDPSGSGIQLSMPETIFGDEYIFERSSGGTNICVPFYLDNGEFTVELQLSAGA